MIRRLLITSCILSILALFSANSVYANYPSTSEVNEINDPFESFNRSVYRFNQGFDAIVLKPVSDTYRTVVPSWGRDRIRSFLRNLLTPITFLNSILQGDSQNAFTSFWRFTLNSTLGIGGLFDIAEVAGLKERREDFGQTLGKYGMNSGVYLVIPFLGSSSARDFTGKIVDTFSDPFNYVFSGEALIVRNAVEVVQIRSDKDKLLTDINSTSLDPYATIRSLYLQHRSDVIRNGKPSPTP